MKPWTTLLFVAGALMLAQPAHAQCGPTYVETYASPYTETHVYYDVPGCRSYDYYEDGPTYTYDDGPYYYDDGYYSRARERRHVRNTLLGVGVANELFNRGSSRGGIRTGVLGGIVLNELIH